MRKGEKPEIVVSEDGAVFGVNLSADFCAEHEWGIKRLMGDFGITDDIAQYGMVRRKITICPKTIAWVEYTKEKEKYAGFIFREYFYDEKPSRAASESTELYIYKPFRPRKDEKPRTLAAAWSESDFAVVSTDPAQIAQLKEIFNEFARLNIVIMIGARELFGNGGLIIGIADRIPQKYVDMWYAADKDWHEIRKEVEASGIEELLKKAGKRYYALSPRRQKDGTIHFWLNPMEQDKNNYGWFTYEALKLWALGEGPIPKEKKPAHVN